MLRSLPAWRLPLAARPLPPTPLLPTPLFAGLLVVLAVGAACSVVSAQGFSFDAIELTNLGQGVRPTAINNQGQIVGQAANGQAFIYENGTLTTIGTLGGNTSTANDINENGVIVGQSEDGEGIQKAFSFTVGDNALMNLDPNTPFTSNANAINNAAEPEIVGFKAFGGTNNSTLWDAANPTGLLLFAPGNHQATGINDQSQIVGVTLEADGSLDGSFFFNPIDPIDDFSGNLGTNFFPLSGVNSDSIAAGLDIADTASLISIGASQETTLDFLEPTDTFSQILGFNDADLFVGESGMQGFVFNNSTGELTNINDFYFSGDFSPEAILAITDINDDGTFVGIARQNGIEYGIQGRGIEVPEPSTAAMVLTMLAGLGGRRLREDG